MKPLYYLADLTRAFPGWHKGMTQTQQSTTLALYEQHLEDIPEQVLAHACASLIRTEQWFPSISKIRNTCVEYMLQLPTEYEAIQQIEARIAWARQDEDARGEPPAVSSLVEAVLSLCGGFPAWREAEDQAVLRGQFGRLYRDARARAVGEAQIGPMALPESLQRRQLAP